MCMLRVTCELCVFNIAVIGVDLSLVVIRWSGGWMRVQWHGWRVG